MRRGKAPLQRATDLLSVRRLLLASTLLCLGFAATPVTADEGEVNGEKPAALAARLRSAPSPERALELARCAGAASELRAALETPRTGALVAWALSEHPVPALREELEKALYRGDQVVAYWAARALGRGRDPRSFEALASRLARKPRTYWELARWSRGGYRPVFHRIRRGMDKTIFATPEIPNLRVACAAMEALGALPGDEPLTVLEEALRSEQHLVRYGAVQGWRQRGGRRARALLARVAATDPVLYVRRAARRSLRALETASGRGSDRSGAERSAPSLDRRYGVPAIVFIKTDNRSESNMGFRDSYFFPKTPWYASGQDLYVLEPPAPHGELRNLTRLGEGGAVQGPEISPSAQHVLVGLRERAGEPFHIFEVSIESGERRQLTSGAANDVDPCYLLDGRIAFSSDRDGTLEYYHQERTRALYVADADGGDPRQITFNPNQDYEPLLLADGRLLYSSYRFYGQDGSGGVFSRGRGSIARIETQLRTVRPDGTHDSHLYGSHRGGLYVPVRELPDSDQFQAPSLLRNHDHLGVSVSQARELDDGRLICMTPSGLTIVDPELDPRDCEIPIFPEVVNLAGGEEVYIHDHDDMNPVGRYTSPHPVGERLLLVSHAPWSARGKDAYGIYLLDLETGGKTLVYDDPDVSDVDALPVVPWRQRPRLAAPHRLPSASDSEGRGEATATVVISSVFESELDFDRSRVRYLQVVAAERLATSMNANGGFRSRVLATVPIEKDGSVYLEVPADTALHFNLLDENEAIFVHETAFNSFRGGERRSCVGCHEQKNAAPPNRVPRALSKPAYRARETNGDLIYMGDVRKSYSVLTAEADR